ncbi:MAG: dinitrogenase iron-molybdenum cofactor biosynthesis protein [Desulfobacteraceae bacterium]|nr:NifB/NifX family molybdenum-iron cluster-binding protein [Desulfobacteraceae bacterium]MBC2756569.1 dinitrogenase iron-molybdenum cofactor biosynthesis protein [Desulfobacteraceae bacterium]
MKIAVSSKGVGIDSEIDERFGRAAYILIIDSDSLDVEVLDNSENINAAQGAGIQAASMVSGKGAEALLTGSCGPKAMTAFSATGIQVFTGQTGTVRQAVERFKQGGLQPSAGANVVEKFGMTGGSGVNAGGPQSRMGGGSMGGSGRGMGMKGGGRGMGGGGRCMGGSGRGMGGGRGMGMQGVGNFPPAASSKQESLAELKKQAADLQQQMEEIQRKIKNI